MIKLSGVFVEFEKFNRSDSSIYTNKTYDECVKILNKKINNKISYVQDADKLIFNYIKKYA